MLDLIPLSSPELVWVGKGYIACWLAGGHVNFFTEMGNLFLGICIMHGVVFLGGFQWPFAFEGETRIDFSISVVLCF